MAFDYLLRVVLLVVSTTTASVRGHSVLPEQASHAYTVNDELRMEGIGKARIDPTGHWLVYERRPPYRELPNFGIPEMAAWDVPGGKIMKVDLHAESPVAVPLHESGTSVIEWIDSFSPDGRYLVYYSVEKDEIVQHSCELAEGIVRDFAPSPHVDWYFGHHSSWVSREAFVYSAEPTGISPVALGLRPYTDKELAAAHGRTWAGREPSFSELISRADGGGQRPLPGRLIEANVRTGTYRVLRNGRFDDIQVSPDGRYIAALLLHEKTQPDPSRLVQDAISSRAVLTVIDLVHPDLGVTLTQFENVVVGSLVWADKKASLAFYAWTNQGDARNGCHYILDLPSGNVAPAPHTGLDLVSQRERGLSQVPEPVVWIGDEIAVFARATSPNSVGTLTYRDFGEVSQRTDWFLLRDGYRPQNLTAGLLKQPAPDAQVRNSQMFVSAADGLWRIAPGTVPLKIGEAGITDRYSSKGFLGRFVMAAEKGGHSEINVIGLTDHFPLIQVVPQTAGALFLTASVPSRAVVYTENTEAGSELVLVRDGTKIVLDRLNQFLADVVKPHWSSIDYELKPGYHVESAVLLPVDFRPGRKYPVIVDIYPGTGAVPAYKRKLSVISPFPARGQIDGYPVEVLAGKGYIVFRPANPRDFIRRPDAPLGGMKEAVERGLQALTAQGYVDPDRIGLMGFSQGGFSALWLATQMPRFKAVVSINGWADFWSHYYQGMTIANMFYPDQYFGAYSRYESAVGTETGLGKTPWSDPMAYLQNGALLHAPKVVAPILMVHSDMDMFPLVQYEEMFNALYRLRKEAKLIRYWGEGHGPSSPANMEHMWSEIFDWFDRWCAPHDISKQ